MSRREDTVELERLRAAIQLKDRDIANLQSQVSDVRGANENLKRENRELREKVSDLTKVNQELRNEVANLKRQRPSLRSENLASTFQKSIEKMQEGLKAADSRVGYAVSDLDVTLRTNMSLDEQGEIRFQLPTVGEKVAPEGLSTIRFSLKQVPKVEPPTPDKVEIPNLIGLDRESAIQRINEAGPTVGTITERKSLTTPGFVIEQSPEPYAMAPKGTKVDLVISRVSLAKVPNLIGMGLKNASELIKNAGLTVGEVVERESASKPGTVISQNIPAGTSVPIETRLDLVIAKPEETKAPNILGKTLEEAKGILKAAKLVIGEIGYETSRQPPNVVIRQSPQPNTAVPSNSAVDVTLSKGSRVRAPNLIGRSLREAEGMLKDEGLTRGKVVERPSMKTEGTVVGQTPSPGTEVEIGGSVDLETSTQRLEVIEGIGARIGARLRRINVNNVLDLVNTPIANLRRAVGEANARNLLTKARLIVGKESLEGVVEREALELVIRGGDVYTRESLAESNARELYAKIREALEEGRVELHEGYRLTREKIGEWIRRARG